MWKFIGLDDLCDFMNEPSFDKITTGVCLSLTLFYGAGALLTAGGFLLIAWIFQ